MTQFMISLLCLVVLTTTTAAQFAPPFIIFGDSTVDTGTNNFIKTTIDFKADVAPYGQDYFDIPTGRWSNGRVIVDFICDYAGLPFVSPYLKPDADHGKGVSFASGGGGVLITTNEGMVVSLSTQLHQFTEFQEMIYEKWGSHQAKQYTSDAIYLVSIGSNDYLAGYLGNLTAQGVYSPQEFIEIVVSELIKAYEFLYSNGARKLIVFGLGPLGCIPALRTFSPTSECFQVASDMAVAHNAALTWAVKEWKMKHLDVTVVEALFYDFLEARQKNPATYGLVEGVKACCGAGPIGGSGKCGRNTGDPYNLCQNPNEYVYWDPYHPSEIIHEQFARALWYGSKPSLRDLFGLPSTPCSEDGLVPPPIGSADRLHAGHFSI